jgi:hypothetical protein
MSTRPSSPTSRSWAEVRDRRLARHALAAPAQRARPADIVAFPRRCWQTRCPRDLRSSYVTLRLYEGVPLTTIARKVGTSVLMIEQHYAGVIENWDGERVPADQQIRAARSASGRGMDVMTNRGDTA